MRTWTYINIKGQGHSLTLVQGHLDSSFSTFFSLETTWPIEPNFMWRLHGMGKQKFVQMVQVSWPIWPPCAYMVKTVKIFFPGTKRPMILKLGIQHRVFKYYQAYSNNDSGLTLTYFTARSCLVSYAFVWDNGKTMDFSENLAVCDNAIH